MGSSVGFSRPPGNVPAAPGCAARRRARHAESSVRTATSPRFTRSSELSFMPRSVAYASAAKHPGGSRWIERVPSLVSHPNQDGTTCPAWSAAFSASANSPGTSRATAPLTTSHTWHLPSASCVSTLRRSGSTACLASAGAPGTEAAGDAWQGAGSGGPSCSSVMLGRGRTGPLPPALPTSHPEAPPGEGDACAAVGVAGAEGGLSASPAKAAGPPANHFLSPAPEVAAHSPPPPPPPPRHRGGPAAARCSPQGGSGARCTCGTPARRSRRCPGPGAGGARRWRARGSPCTPSA
mmetsp:Transcript_25434/g.87106  ORF Transcript_25434/g.87106 Transcript_25434/m.87106 type:complete len:294 (+) Transcript_25434:510-1391(+)